MVLVGTFVVLTLGYFSAPQKSVKILPFIGPVKPVKVSTSPFKATKAESSSQFEHEQMIKQLKRELEESVSEAEESETDNVSFSGKNDGIFSKPTAESEESDDESDEEKPLNKVDAPKTNDKKSGGALAGLISSVVSCFSPKSTRVVGVNEYESYPATQINRLKYPEFRVEHPDSPVHMCHNPDQPYGAYNSHLANVDVDLAKLNPPYTIKNLPLHFGTQGMYVQPQFSQPHLATPHADDKPALRSIQLPESSFRIAAKLNPTLEGFDETAPKLDIGTCEDTSHCKTNENFYAKNYHLTGGKDQKYVTNDSSLNGLIQTNMVVLISTLIAELKYTLSEREIRDSLCDIVRTILNHRNTSLREFFTSKDAYNSFINLVMLVADKVENSTSISIIQDVFGDVLRQMRLILADRLDVNVNKHMDKITDVHRKASSVNLDRICGLSFPSLSTLQTIPRLVSQPTGKSVFLYGGNNSETCKNVPCQFKTSDPAIPPVNSLGQVVSGNLQNSGQFFGPQGMLCPTGYPGVKYGAEFVRD